MKKNISHAWYAGGVKEVDTDSGAMTTVKNIKWGETEFGSVWKQNSKWFAFYADDKSLLLQHKSQKWRVTPDTKVTLSGLFFRKFKIIQNGKIVFSIKYRTKGLMASIIDPTYDAIDMESDDFFLYVSNMWKSWGNKDFSEFNALLDETYNKALNKDATDVAPIS